MDATPFIWMNDDAEQAIAHWRSVFGEDLSITHEQRHPDGNLFIAEIALFGRPYTLMNAGPHHPHTPAFSLLVAVDGQAEVDRVSDGLIGETGEQGPCGWLTDPYGLSWQVVPDQLAVLMNRAPEAVGTALRTMTRIDIAALEAAAG